MKILIVKYLPSGENSKTLALLEHLKSKINQHQVEEVDLLQTPASAHNLKTMQAYKVRNFGGQPLSEELALAIAPMDKMAKQFKLADLVVLATPMHNFSLPGAVKNYFDAIMQSGVTFKYEGDKQQGLMGDSRFITLYTSMGTYKSEYGFLDNLKTIVKIELDFMGFKEYEFIHAATGNEITLDLNLNRAKEKIDNVVTSWM
jgi:FMN-dependent NADH-azoreductase